MRLFSPDLLNENPPTIKPAGSKKLNFNKDLVKIS
jgi:hypothetical protein